MKLNLCISSILLLLSVNTFSQEKVFEKFISQDFKKLNIENFQKDWLTLEQEYDNLSGNGHIGFQGFLKNRKTQVFYSGEKDGSIKDISINFGDVFLDKMDFSQWRKLNYFVYISFLKSLGKPDELIVKEKINFEFIWKREGYYINLSLGQRDTAQYAGHCNIDINKKRHTHGYFYDYFIADKTMQVFKNTLWDNLKKIKPASEESVQKAFSNISAIQKSKHLVDSPSRTFYRKFYSSLKNSLNLMELKLSTDVFHDAVEEKPAKDDTYCYWIYQDEFIRESGQAKMTGGKSEDFTNVYKYYYDEQKLLRAITFKGVSQTKSYWVEYDENGYLSRVTYFKDKSHEGTYLYHGNDFYDQMAVSLFDKNNNLIDAHVKAGKYYHKGGLNLRSCFKKHWFYSKNSNFHKKFKLNTPTPNHHETFTVKPKVFFNTKELFTKSIQQFVNYSQAISSYRNWTKEQWTKNQLKPKNLFTDYSSLIAHIEKPSDQLFPIAVVQIGKEAVKFIDQNKKFSIYKKNQLVLDRYQLTSISLKTVELKDLKTKKTLTLEKGKALKVGKGTVITINGEKHLVYSGDNFLGSIISINDEDKVSIDDKEINSQWHFLSLKPSADSSHKLSNCSCYTKSDKFLKIDPPPKEDLIFIDDTPATPKVSLDYYLENCFIYLDVHTKGKDPEVGTYVKIDEGHSVYSYEKGKLVKSEPKMALPGKKYTLKMLGKSLYIGGHKVRDLKIKYSREGVYGVKIDPKTYVILRYAPKTYKVLSSLILDSVMKAKNTVYDVYNFRGAYHNYYLEDLKKFQKEKITFSMNEIKSEIIINKKSFKVNFGDFEVLVTSPDGTPYVFSTESIHSPFD